MEKMQLCVSDFDRYNDVFPLWSIVYIKIRDEDFPDNQWWDATSSILDMWIDNLCRLICGSISHCTLDFMDGDYMITLTSKNQREANAVFWNPQMKPIMSETIDILHFSRQILSAVEKMNVFYATEKNSHTIRNLSNKADKLRVLMKNL